MSAAHKALRYICLGCLTVGAPVEGDQRDPGPFLPKGWKSVGGEALCCDCVDALPGFRRALGDDDT